MEVVLMLGCYAAVFLSIVSHLLLEELLQKEKEYQQVLKATLQQRTHDLELVKVRHRPPEISPPSIFQIPADHEPDKQLTDWLKEQGADTETIDKFVLEEYTLTDILSDVTKDDLHCLRLRVELVRKGVAGVWPEDKAANGTIIGENTTQQIHPSIHFHPLGPGPGRGGSSLSRDAQTSPHPRHFLQLFRGILEAFPGQSRET
ncbi:hypothetical protein L3Q82_004679 [Scortum barcoo]|uniref:Uncharacterized protein n=1 Tax=Scortum barcoo TaxID=214431 RepID=A0ACB8VGY3_9TELE|nr:hypothetical protein L3Q82_004679 [Scortum barcoo]